MPITVLSPADLRLTNDPDALGFVDTSELIEEPLPWIGQARAKVESARIEKAWKVEKTQAYAALSAFAEGTPACDRAG